MNFRLFRKQNLFLSLVLFVGVLISTNSIFSYDISYQDLIASRDDAEHSELAQEFNRLSCCEERIARLFSKCEHIANDMRENVLRLRVVNVPNKAIIDNFFLNVDFIPYKQIYLWDFEDQNSFELVKAGLIFNHDGKLDHCGLAHLMSMDPHFVEEARISSSLISGNTLMNIFDSLCYLLAVPKVKLQDASRVYNKLLSGMSVFLSLAILRPYISEDHKTWYGKFGYVKSRDREEYENSLNFLVNRPISELVEDFAHDQEVSFIINKYHLRLQCNDLDLLQSRGRSISDLVRAIYIESKSDMCALGELLIFYSKCLDRYTAFEGKKNLTESQNIRLSQIVSAQEIVNKGDSYWEKSYSR